jgi:hypothetical protein
MIKVISDTTFKSWHEEDVKSAVKHLQRKGYCVTKIDRIKIAHLFDDRNITEITYENKHD